MILYQNLGLNFSCRQGRIAVLSFFFVLSFSEGELFLLSLFYNEVLMELINNKYTMQGIDLVDVAQEFGTPVYVYDAAKIDSQVKRLSDAFSEVSLKLKYAMKSLSNQAVLKVVKKAGAGVDTVSIQEVALAIQAGFSPEEIMYTPNGVSFEEIQAAVEFGVNINIDNLSTLKKFGEEYGSAISCCVRLNPHVMGGGHKKISTGHIGSKFGISVHQVNEIFDLVKEYDLHINGLHIHTGSDILDVEVFLKAAKIVFDNAKQFPNLEFLDFGSGFKVAYKEGDIVTDIESLGQQLTTAFKIFCAEYGTELELWFEPGKFIVSESGVLLTTTNVVKTTPVTVFAGVDSGLNHLLRPMMYDSYHHIVNISNPDGAERVYSVVGNICETDTLGSDRKLNDVREGDVLAILNGGAYGISMASNYNSRLRPAEVMIINGEAKLIRSRDTLEDLLHNQIDIDID